MQLLLNEVPGIELEFPGQSMHALLPVNTARHGQSIRLDCNASIRLHCNARADGETQKTWASKPVISERNK